MMTSSRLALLSAAVLLGGCASSLDRSQPLDGDAPMPPALADWSERDLPGKRSTDYSFAARDGRACVLARADRSVSVWRRSLRLDAARLEAIEFDWWIATQPSRASIADPAKADAAVRLVLGFDGDEQRLSLRNRLQFELARTLTGESPPYATLIYAWDPALPLDTVIVSARSDRIREIVVGSGRPAHSQWQRLRRNPRADFERAFGEAPGALITMGVMTDGDNTVSRAEACYGDIVLLDAGGQALEGSLRL